MCTSVDCVIGSSCTLPSGMCLEATVPVQDIRELYDWSKLYSPIWTVSGSNTFCSRLYQCLLHYIIHNVLVMHLDLYSQICSYLLLHALDITGLILIILSKPIRSPQVRTMGQIGLMQCYITP